jgi:uncharacterized membrane protein
MTLLPPARAAALSLIAIPVVATAVGPARLAQAMQGLADTHPHAPDLGLIARQPPAIQLHLAAVLVALLVGVVLLAGVKGTRVHRVLGWTWVLAMMTAAAASLFIRILGHGQFSFIHLLSGWTLLALPVGVAFARRHAVKPHARTMTGLFAGGLILAGLLAFTPGRLMWRLIFG